MLDRLTALVEKSLVVYEEQAGQSRYRLLETIRQYARERLLQHRESERLRAQHLEYFLRLAEEEQPQADRTAWLERCEVEHDNVRAALAWCAEQEEYAEVGLRLAGALHYYWNVRGHEREGRRWLERMLEQGRDASAKARVKGLFGAAALAGLQGDHPQATVFAAECLTLSRAIGDKQSAARALRLLGNEASSRHDPGSARPLFQESVTLFREVGDRPGTAASLHNLGVLQLDEGDPAGARTLIEESLAIQRELGTTPLTALNLVVLARAARQQGDYEAARAHLKESLALAQQVGYPRVLARDLEGFAALAEAQGQMERAARLFGAAESLREAVQLPAMSNVRADDERSIAVVRAAMGEEAFAAAWHEGRTMSAEQAVRAALAEPDDD